MAKSESAKAMDELQLKLNPRLKALGFRVRGRSFNRQTADSLTQVIEFQMGRFDPPGTYEIPGVRKKLYGKFTVAIGVYVPEVSQAGGFKVGSFVREMYCCVRTRLGNIGPEHEDLWWDVACDDDTASELWQRLVRDALPFLEKFESRDSILRQWLPEATSPYSNRPRIECAIILAVRGKQNDALALLAAQANCVRKPGHTEYLCELAKKLGLGALDLHGDSNSHQ